VHQQRKPITGQVTAAALGTNKRTVPLLIIEPEPVFPAAPRARPVPIREKRRIYAEAAKANSPTHRARGFSAPRHRIASLSSVPPRLKERQGTEDQQGCKNEPHHAAFFSSSFATLVTFV
jgi:hypothetical protein